jgi:hypothetical protein
MTPAAASSAVPSPEPLAPLWLAHREGLVLHGAVVAEVPLGQAIAKLDLAPWRLFTTAPPVQVPVEEVGRFPGRKRALVEIREQDRGELFGLSAGFYESPYSLQECLRRVGARAAA